jgi:hypothetical protein
VFLELISLLPPNSLYHDLWPKILDLKMPRALALSLLGSLHEDQEKRNTFEELFLLLSSAEGSEIADQDNEEYADYF